MLKGVTCETCGQVLTFSNEGAFCAACKARAQWPDEKLRALYLQLEPLEVETDPEWWKCCLAVVREVIGAHDDVLAMAPLIRAGWTDLSYAARLRRMAGIPQREYECSTCGGSGKVKR